MGKYDPKNSLNYYCGIDINNLQIIGQGRQGRVYSLPDEKVIKVFNNMHSCSDQLNILQHAENSRFFPKVYDYDEYSIIIDYVSGLKLNQYLRNNKLSQKISFQLAELMNEFKKLKFTRIDIRLVHIFVQADESVKIIDPRSSFDKVQPYPLLMFKGLSEYKALEDFFNHIIHEYPDEYKSWKKQWESRDSR